VSARVEDSDGNLMTVGIRKRGNAAAETKKARKAGAFILDMKLEARERRRRGRKGSYFFYIVRSE
jgi:hypothetical protein